MKLLLQFLLSAGLLWNSNAHAAYEDVPDSLVIQEIAPAPSTGILPTKLSVLTWNIHKAEAKSQWQQDLAALSSGKHLVLLQEGVEEPFITNTLRSISSLGWWMARAFFMETNRNATGVVTGAFQAPWSSVFLRSPDREPVVNTPKMSLLTTHQMQDGIRMLVINIHAINFTTTAAFRRQIEAVSGIIRGWKERVLFAGDFNTWSPGRSEYLRNLTRNLGMKEVSFGNDTRKLVLDHIFIRGCSAYAAEVRSDIDSSDHFPLTTELLCAD